MTQSPNTPPDSKPAVEKKEMTEQEKNRAKAKEKLKFYGFVALLVIMCIVFIWFIFKPDKKQQDEGAGGINYTVPEASIQDTESDKRKAIEMAEMEDKQRQRVRSLFDFDDAFGGDEGTQQAAVPAADPILQSQQTARQLNDQVMSFYQTPREDPQVAELKRQLEDMSQELRRQQEMSSQANDFDEMAFLERSFEMASRYMPGQQNQSQEIPAGTQPEQKREIVGASRADQSAVSSLMEFELTPQPRNYGFVTAVGHESVAVSNAIRACVSNDQTITAGAQVRLRLLEPLRVGNYLIPVNSPIYGNARIEGQRVSVVVTSIESEGNIIPVELVVHDMDGQAGLNVPNTMERTAAKEALASIGQGFGSSISFAQSAGQQVAMDLTRGVMNAGSQYVSSKMREVKINLKAGYQVLLIAKQ